MALIAHCVFPEPVRPVISQPRTKSSIDQESPPSRRMVFPELSAASKLQAPKRAQSPMTTNDRGGASRKYPAKAPATHNRKRTESTIFINGFWFECCVQEIEQPSLWVGNILRVGFEIDRGDARLICRKRLVQKSVHGGEPEGEILAKNEVRVSFAADGHAGWGFDWHRK